MFKPLLLATIYFGLIQQYLHPERQTGRHIYHSVEHK